MSEHHTPPPKGAKKGAKVIVAIILAIVVVVFVGYNASHRAQSDQEPASGTPHAIDQPQ